MKLSNLKIIRQDLIDDKAMWEKRIIALRDKLGLHATDFSNEIVDGGMVCNTQEDVILAICDMEKEVECDRKQIEAIDERIKAFANKVEQEKIYGEFNYECAYCGSKHNLLLEHIVSQRKYAESNPELVDLIHNCIIACENCNESKGKIGITDWYNEKLPFFTKERLIKIKKHWNMYMPNAETLNKIKIA
jgi:5-methylcytosine-specific restriction endonuclease McrA